MMLNEQQNNQQPEYTDDFAFIDLEALAAEVEADIQPAQSVDTKPAEAEGYPQCAAATANDYDAIPDELKQRNQWALFNCVKSKDGHTAKIPYRAGVTGRQSAASTDLNTWAPFDTAVSSRAHLKVSDIAFAFNAADPYTVVDLDDVIDPATGEVDPWAQSIIGRLNSYTEVSRSHTGCHIIVRATKPGKQSRTNNRPSFEIYDTARFMICTGLHIDGTPTAIEERQAEIDALYAEVFAPKQTEAAPERVGTGATTGGFPQCGPSASTTSTVTAGHRKPLDDTELLNMAMSSPKNGSEFTALWNGDTTAYSSNHSAADQALVNMLAYWSGRDASQMDRLFRQSGLMRPKWNELRGAQTYAALTITKAIADTTRCYGDGQQPVKASSGNGAVSTPAARTTAANRNANEAAIEPDDTDTSHMAACMTAVMAYVEPSDISLPLKEAAESFYENHQLLDDYERECLKIQLQKNHINPEIVLTLINLGEPKEPVQHLTTAQILAMSFEPREELPLFGIPGAGAFIKDVAACLTASPSAGKTEMLSRSARYWKCPVLFISEEPVRTWFDRLTNMQSANLPDNPMLEILPASGRGHSFVLNAIKEATKGTVVIVDSARDFSGVVTEADGPEWVAAIDPWIRAADKQGVTLIVLHHDKKNASGNAIDSASGSNALMSRFGQRIHLKASGENNQYLKVEGIARAGKVNKTFWKWSNGTIVKDDKGSEHHTKGDSVNKLLLEVLDTMRPQTVAELQSVLEGKGKKTSLVNVRKELNNLKDKGLAECTIKGNDKIAKWVKTPQASEVE